MTDEFTENEFTEPNNQESEQIENQPKETSEESQELYEKRMEELYFPGEQNIEYDMEIQI